MKNKFRQTIFLIFINFFITPHLLCKEINFEANFIELIDEEKRIIAKKNVKIFNENEIIYADEMDYDKLKQIIKAKGNIRIKDIDQNLEIVGEELIYFKNQEKLILNKNVNINYDKKVSFKTDEVTYDKIKKQIMVSGYSNIKDNFGNKISSEKSKFLLIEKLLKINSVEMNDEIGNKYYFENAIINFKSSEIIADDIKIDFLSPVLVI